MKVTMFSQHRTKRALRHSIAFTVFLASLIFTAIGSQLKTAVAQVPDNSPAMVNIVTGPRNMDGNINFHVVDADGNPINVTADPSTPIFRNYPDNPPITAPVRMIGDPPMPASDGHQLTLGEWLAGSGTARLESKADGTEVDIQMTGLIPHGVYSAWGFWWTNDKPFNPELPVFGDRFGGGSIGNNLGTDNMITVDGDGNGSFTMVWPSGEPSSLGGDIVIPDWALDRKSFNEFVIVGAYHYDEMTWGPVPGPNHAGAFITTFAVPEPSSIVLALFAAIGFAVLRPRRRRSSMA